LPVAARWEEPDVLPSDVRSARPLYHREFLEMVTPEGFRGGTLYPGLDVFPLMQALAGEVRQANRRRREEAIRRRIREELRHIIEAQTKARVP
jgi:hypothetical protein